MIQFVSVTKQYGKNITAVEDISLELQKGEFTFLVGPSGSGKTTLIRMLIREELPSVGKIYFDDEDITIFKRKQVYSLRRKIGVIFQDYKLIPELNAYENVAFAMEASGKSDKKIKETTPYLLEIVGLAERMHFFPKQLSGGEQQRVAIARAIANDPQLLIADEPTGNLDPDSAWDIVQILSKINGWGTTVIMSTHGSEIVNSLHKRVIRMENGKLVRDDYRGSYEDVDEFSLNILSKNQEQKEPLVQSSKITIKNDSTTKEEDIKTNSKKSKKSKSNKKSVKPKLEVKEENKEIKDPENKKNYKKNIIFKTKKPKKIETEDKNMEKKVLESLENKSIDQELNN